MGETSEFSLLTRAFLRTYRWRKLDPVPWTPVRGELADARLALVSTAGFVLPEQEPFDKRPGGDFTFRVIPRDTELGELVDTHRSYSYDHAPLRSDPNLAFPLDRLRELERGGRIGAVAPRHLSFMGSILAPGRLTRDSAPEAAALLQEDDVDVALLVPV